MYSPPFLCDVMLAFRAPVKHNSDRCGRTASALIPAELEPVRCAQDFGYCDGAGIGVGVGDEAGDGNRY